MMKKMSEKGEPLLLRKGLSGADCNDGRVYNHWANTGAAPYNSTSSKYWGDPKQGCIGDCWFLAALSSVALVANLKLNTHPTYRFFDVGANAWGAAFQINEDLPVDGSGNLVYGRTASGFIWPCLYEKAYAVWKTGNQQPNYPNVLSGGVGANGLLTIAGGVLGPVKTMPLFNPLGRPQYPTVASTNSGASGVLTPDHEYSVMKKTAAGYQLRNPCGGVLINNITDAQLNTYFKDWRYVVPP